jgi:hypothetical protein
MISWAVDEEEELVNEPASKARLADVHITTDEDISKGTYSIEDVVLPLPGSQIKYPTHSTAEVLRCPVCDTRAGILDPLQPPCLSRRVLQERLRCTTLARHQHEVIKICRREYVGTKREVGI